MSRRPANVAVSDDLNTPKTSCPDSTSEQEDLHIPKGMVAVTAASSAKGKLTLVFRRLPASDVHNWRNYPEQTESLSFEEWCCRVVTDLRRAGRVAMVVYGIRKGLTVCQVIANELEHVTFLSQLQQEATNDE